jgi:hypothetical protein
METIENRPFKRICIKDLTIPYHILTNDAGFRLKIIKKPKMTKSVFSKSKFMTGSKRTKS